MIDFEKGDVIQFYYDYYDYDGNFVKSYYYSSGDKDAVITYDGGKEEAFAGLIQLQPHKRNCFIGKSPCLYNFERFRKLRKCYYNTG